MEVDGNARVMKDVGGRMMYLPVQCMEFDGKPANFIRKDHDYLLIFEPVGDKIVDGICALPRVDRVVIWYGSLSDQQRKRILQKFPKCKVVENMNLL